MIAFVQKIDKVVDPLRSMADKIGTPLLYLTIRLFMQKYSFRSGWLKFKNYLNGDWGSTVYLFQDIHPIPAVPANIAAVAGTAGELVLSVLLIFWTLWTVRGSGYDCHDSCYPVCRSGKL